MKNITMIAENWLPRHGQALVRHAGNVDYADSVYPMVLADTIDVVSAVIIMSGKMSRVYYILGKNRGYLVKEYADDESRSWIKTYWYDYCPKCGKLKLLKIRRADKTRIDKCHYCLYVKESK